MTLCTRVSAVCRGLFSWVIYELKQRQCWWMKLQALLYKKLHLLKCCYCSVMCPSFSGFYGTFMDLEKYLWLEVIWHIISLKIGSEKCLIYTFFHLMPCQNFIFELHMFLSLSLYLFFLFFCFLCSPHTSSPSPPFPFPFSLCPLFSISLPWPQHMQVNFLLPFISQSAFCPFFFFFF